MSLYFLFISIINQDQLWRCCLHHWYCVGRNSATIVCIPVCHLRGMRGKCRWHCVHRESVRGLLSTSLRVRVSLAFYAPRPCQRASQYISPCPCSILHRASNLRTNSGGIKFPLCIHNYWSPLDGCFIRLRERELFRLHSISVLYQTLCIWCV